MSRIIMFLKMIKTNFLHNLCSSFHLSKNHHNHHGAKNRIRNEIFLLPTTTSSDAKVACHPAIILGYSSVCTNENEVVRFVCGVGGGEGWVFNG